MVRAISDTFSNFAEFLTGKRARNQATVERIAAAEAAGTATEQDFEELAVALTVLNLTRKDYDALRAIFATREELRLESAGASVRHKQACAAAAKRDAYILETARIFCERQRIERELTANCVQMDWEFQRADAAAKRLQALEYEHAELLGLKRPSLDNLTLTCGGTIGAGDPAWATIELPSNAFRAENERRYALMRCALARQREEHAEKVQAFNQRVKNVGWERAGNPPQMPSSPTWAEVLSDKTLTPLPDPRENYAFA